MIIGKLIELVAYLFNPVIDRLPSGELNLPSPVAMGTAIGQVDSLIPIVGPLAVVGVLLAAGVLFLGFRLVLFVWKLVP